MLLNKSIVDEYIKLRKMDPNEKMKLVELQGNHYKMDFDEVIKLSKDLSLDISLLLKGITQSDLDKGVKIARKDGYYRENIKNGKKYYTYNHLVTTSEYPTLMPLRVGIHIKNGENVMLNDGHKSTEIVYITKGEVNMDWEFKGNRYTKTLYEGDSAYISPYISHSFTSNSSQDSELIAINW